jgi:hypothetical protein
VEISQTGVNGDRATWPRTAAPHKKTLRPKSASYSESIIQDYRRDEIPTELAKLYDMGEIIGIGTTSKVSATTFGPFRRGFMTERRPRVGLEALTVILKSLSPYGRDGGTIRSRGRWCEHGALTTLCRAA